MGDVVYLSRRQQRFRDLAARLDALIKETEARIALDGDPSPVEVFRIASATTGAAGEVTVLLREIRDELKRLRIE